jgi:hypothetical protein
MDPMTVEVAWHRGRHGGGAGTQRESNNKNFSQITFDQTLFFFQVGNHGDMSNMHFSNVFGLIRRFLRAVQTSRKARLPYCFHSAMIFVNLLSPP